MSRIRSIHPGLWTDEAFMGLSAHARLLFIGLWNEAFDDGVFEWKPLTLKARIFPVDGVDVPALLAELVAADCVRACGKYGLVRNFRHFQRPKKPNSSGMLQPQDHEYVGLVPKQSPTNTELDEQMEEGGDKMKEEKESPPVAPAGGGAALFSELAEAYPHSAHSVLPKAERLFAKLTLDDQRAAISKASAVGATSEADRRKRGRDADAHAEFVKGLDSWLREGLWRSTAPAPTPIVAMTKLDRLLDDKLWLACEAVMGKPAPTSDNTWSFRDDIIAQARARCAA